MAENWRLIDAGLDSPARNIASNRALLEARHAGETPGTLRFARFTPCAVLAFQQSADQELDLDFCRSHAIPVQRRITGGPAVYLDERHLVWELYLHRRDVGSADLRSIAKRIIHAAATAFSALGVEARYRARSDVEVDGRTLASGGLSVDGDAILFQGVVAIDADVAHGFSTLRTPWSASASVATEARKRLTSLRDALGRHADVARVKHNLAEAFESEFDIEFRDADLGLSEQARCNAAVPQIDSTDWVDHIARPQADAPLLAGTHQAEGGTLCAVVKYERHAQTIKQVWFAGEAAVDPRRLFCELEAALRDIPAARVTPRVEAFFASRPPQAHGFVPGDFTSALLHAVRQSGLAAKS